MADGYNVNKIRKDTLSSFGKDLARRSKSSCELSGKTGVPLQVYEISPVPKEPNFEHCLFLSEAAVQQLAKPSKHLQPDTWRHLSELIWSETPQVQLMSLRILQYIAKSHSWAQNIIDEAYLDEALIETALEAPLT